MLDHLRAHHTRKRSISKGQTKSGAVYQRGLEFTRESQLAHEDVQCHATLRQCFYNPAGAAANIEDRPLAADQFRNMSEAATLPVALKWNHAVISAIIIIRG